ncbi:hypothetical protein KCP78_15090 [Salmonella enterica subsp. enterica]|nr:hypothetical protein KCP78_15090 [Salmonella enterica subsp. enterica]
MRRRHRLSWAGDGDFLFVTEHSSKVIPDEAPRRCPATCNDGNMHFQNDEKLLALAVIARALQFDQRQRHNGFS